MEWASFLCENGPFHSGLVCIMVSEQDVLLAAVACLGLGKKKTPVKRRFWVRPSLLARERYCENYPLTNLKRDNHDRYCPHWAAQAKSKPQAEQYVTQLVTTVHIGQSDKNRFNTVGETAAGLYSCAHLDYMFEIMFFSHFEPLYPSDVLFNTRSTQRTVSPYTVPDKIFLSSVSLVITPPDCMVMQECVGQEQCEETTPPYRDVQRGCDPLVKGSVPGHTSLKGFVPVFNCGGGDDLVRTEEEILVTSPRLHLLAEIFYLRPLFNLYDPCENGANNPEALVVYMLVVRLSKRLEEVLLVRVLMRSTVPNQQELVKSKSTSVVASVVKEQSQVCKASSGSERDSHAVEGGFVRGGLQRSFTQPCTDLELKEQEEVMSGGTIAERLAKLRQRDSDWEKRNSRINPEDDLNIITAANNHLNHFDNWEEVVSLIWKLCVHFWSSVKVKLFYMVRTDRVLAIWAWGRLGGHLTSCLGPLPRARSSRRASVDWFEDLVSYSVFPPPTSISRNIGHMNALKPENKTN
uniref:Uncharacterized protein n=2 Tax=Timema TaxID=61471 RepID=A0A7R8VG44_TIMDO|nr:unnamed protein product [Timema douglasi]